MVKVKQFNFGAINLGCVKNLVDTQYLLGNILSNQKDFKINYFADPYDKKVEYVFLNTCGFIKAGRDEMKQELQKLLDAGKKVIILGCALQYYKNLKKQDIQFFSNPNVSLLSWDDFQKIDISLLQDRFISKTFGDFNFPTSPRAYTNIQQGFEYIKIAEGCNNSCSFCIIPQIRGKQKSLPMDDILVQIKDLIQQGVKEIIFIAQDTTRYGADLYQRPMLFELLNRVEKLEEEFFYRLLYMYPDVITLQNLKKLKTFKKFLPYFDIPLQHISKDILHKMGRFYNQAYIYKFLDFLYKNFDVRFVRTNLIIGFPGETDKDFKELCNFVKQQDFDNIALFEYHDEPMATSSKLDKKVPDKEIRARFNELKKIVDKKLDAKLNKRKQYINTGWVMDITREDNLIVRPYLHAPEIDSYDEIKFENVKGVYNPSGEINIGDMIDYVI